MTDSRSYGRIRWVIVGVCILAECLALLSSLLDPAHARSNCAVGGIGAILAATVLWDGMSTGRRMALPLLLAAAGLASLAYADGPRGVYAGCVLGLVLAVAVLIARAIMGRRVG